MLRRLELKTQRSKNLEGEGELAARPRLDNDGPITEALLMGCYWSPHKRTYEAHL
jgi:hypothetical protein